MKKTLIVITLVVLMVLPVFAAKEYTQFGASYGHSTLLDSRTFGFHSLYQFGASLSDDFELGFGTDIEVDFSVSNIKEDALALDVILGLATAIKLEENVVLNVTAGPCISAYGLVKDEEATAAIGFGATAGITLIPAGELEEHLQLGFTFGATGTALWTEDTDLFKTNVTGFAAITLRGPMMFSDYDYVPSNIVW